MHRRLWRRKHEARKGKQRRDRAVTQKGTALRSLQQCLTQSNPYNSYNVLAGQARIQEINDIDDGCLLHIFKQLNPLPDLFHVAATCRVSFARLSKQHTTPHMQSVACMTSCTLQMLLPHSSAISFIHPELVQCSVSKLSVVIPAFRCL